MNILAVHGCFSDIDWNINIMEHLLSTQGTGVYSRLEAARAVNRERRLKLKTVPVPGSGSGSDLTEGSLSGSASTEFDPCS